MQCIIFVHCTSYAIFVRFSVLFCFSCFIFLHASLVVLIVCICEEQSVCHITVSNVTVLCKKKKNNIRHRVFEKDSVKKGRMKWLNQQPAQRPSFYMRACLGISKLHHQIEKSMAKKAMNKIKKNESLSRVEHVLCQTFDLKSNRYMHVTEL